GGSGSGSWSSLSWLVGSRLAGEGGGDAFAQLAAQDLAGRADGQALDDLEALGKLEFRDPLREQELAELRQRQGAARLQHDEGARLLAEHRVGHRDHAAGVDPRVLEDQVLDLVAADLLAAAVDQ